MQLVNPLSAFTWTEPLDIHGVAMSGIAEKQGHAFSAHGWRAAKASNKVSADVYGRMWRSQQRPMSASYLSIAREDYRTRHVVPFPRYFIIEPTNICNRRCPFCPIDIVDRRDKDGNKVEGHMSWEAFTRLMAEATRHDVYGLSLYQLGESMLWRGRDRGQELDLSDMVKEAKRLGGFRVVNVSTNGDVRNLDTLLECPVDDVIVSIDGTTPEVYTENRPSTGGADPEAYARTIARVHDFCALKAKMGRTRPFVRLQIINKGNTAKQVPEFIRHWITVPGVDDVFVKHLDSMRPWKGAAVVSDEEDAIKAERVATMPCQHLWAIGSMTVSGAFNACCHDARTELTTRGANVFEMSFHAWWNGDYMTRLRHEHMGGRFRAPCATCRERDPWLG